MECTFLAEQHTQKEECSHSPKPGRTVSADTTRADHHLSPQNRPLQTDKPYQKDGRKDLNAPAETQTKHQNKAADMAHLCVAQNQALGVCRGFVPDIQVCGIYVREDLVNAPITSNTREDKEITPQNNISSIEVQRSEEADTEYITVKVIVPEGNLIISNLYSPSSLSPRKVPSPHSSTEQ